MALSERSDWIRWCIPAGRISDVRVGIHWTFPLFIALYTYRASVMPGGGGQWALVTLTALTLLYLIILAHEFGHVFAARREGVYAESVMIWPLGGLAQLGEDCMGMAEVRIAAAGPAVNLLFFVLLLPVLAIFGVRIDAALFNPFNWTITDWQPHFAGEVMFVLYKANLAVMLFNLIPAFPIDGGRILQGFLYPRYGLVQSVLVTTTISFVFVGVLILWGFFAQNLTLVLIAAFVALNAWQVRRQVQGYGAGARDESEIPGYDFSMGNTTLSKENVGAARARRKKELLARKKARQKAREEREIEEQIDSLLDKISESGMDSLTRQERTFLEKASRRKQ